MKKIVFWACLREKWIDLQQTSTNMISDQYRYRQLH